MINYQKDIHSAYILKESNVDFLLAELARKNKGNLFHKLKKPICKNILSLLN